MKKSDTPVIIDNQACNGCGRCVDVCSVNVLEMATTDEGLKARVARPDDCLFCEACVIDCRQVAIMLNPESKSARIKSISSVVTERTSQKEKKKSFLSRIFGK